MPRNEEVRRSAIAERGSISRFAGAMRCFSTRCFAASLLIAATPHLFAEVTIPEGKGFEVPRSIASMLSKEYRDLDDRRQHFERQLGEFGGAPQYEQRARIGWKVFGFGESLPQRQWVEIDLGVSHPVDGVALVPVDAPITNNSEPGAGFPRRFRVELEDEAGSLTVIADEAKADFPNPGILPVYFRAGGTSARRVRVVLLKPWEKNQHFAYAFGEIMVLQGNRNLATGLPRVTVRSSGSLESPPAWRRENLIDGQSIIGTPAQRSTRSLAHGWESERFSEPKAPTWVKVDLGATRSFDEVRLIFPRLPQYSASDAFGFPRTLRVEAATDARFQMARTLADWTPQTLTNPGFNPITIPSDGLPARYVRVSAGELSQRRDDSYVFALAELQVYAGDTNIALGAEVIADAGSAPPSANFSPAFLTDGLRGVSEIIEWPEWLEMLSRRREILQELTEVRAQLAAIEPAVTRTFTWSSSILLGVVGVGVAAMAYRNRRAQARAVAALQRRIAGDLHDEIGSNLASIAMIAELAQKQEVALKPDDTAEVRRLAIESAAAMRDIVWLIQPGPHDAARLTDRLRAAAGRLLTGLEWKFEVAGLVAAPSLDVQRHLLLALKEMLHNVLRYAEARHVEIRLTVRDDQFVLEVRDDGCGFEMSRETDGHGFTSLRHRADLVQGALEIESNPGKGTRVALGGSLRSLTKMPL